MTYIIIIPIFNEENNIKSLIDEIRNSFLITDNNCINILLINDGSTDNSKELIEKYSKNINKIILLNHFKNSGYGAALKTGIERTKNIAKYVVFADSDLTNPLNDIKKISKNYC